LRAPGTAQLDGLEGRHEPLEPNGSGWLWSAQLGLFFGVYQERLRLFTPAGEVIPAPAERAEQAEKRAERLARRLREQGIDPDAL